MNVKFLICQVLIVLFWGCTSTFAKDYIPPEPIEKEHFIYYLDNPKYLEFSDSILIKTKLHLERIFRDTIEYKINVYIIGDLNYFQRLIRGKFPDWGAAAAYPPKRLIAIKSPDKFNVNKALSE